MTGPVRPNETQSDQVARSAGIVSGAILVSRITGLAREMVMADKFGAGFSYDAFLLAFRFPSMMRTLFAEGAFSSAFIPTFTASLTSGGQTAVALPCYAIGLLGYAGAKILNPAFYAPSDARTPMYVSLLSILVNFCRSVVLLKYFHLSYAALALSTSAIAIVSSLCLFEALRRKLGGIEGRYLVDRIAGVIGASIGIASDMFFEPLRRTFLARTC